MLESNLRIISFGRCHHWLAAMCISVFCGCTQDVATTNTEAVSETGAALLGNLAPGAFFNGQWKLDSNGNGIRESTDASFQFGQAGDIPLVGHWEGAYGELGACSTAVIDQHQVAVYRPTDRSFYLDLDGSRTWNPPADVRLENLAPAVAGYNDYPVLWKTGAGTAGCRTVIGYFRTPLSGNAAGQWLIDTNGTGVFGDLTPGGIREQPFDFGQRGDTPVPIRGFGDDSTSVAAVFRAGQWFIDSGHVNHWDGCFVDKCTTFGVPSSVAFGNPWLRNINTFDGTHHFVDANLNFSWDSPPDLTLTYAQSFEVPVFGNW